MLDEGYPPFNCYPLCWDHHFLSRMTMAQPWRPTTEPSEKHLGGLLDGDRSRSNASNPPPTNHVLEGFQLFPVDTTVLPLHVGHPSRL